MVERRPFAPLNYISGKVEGITFFNPLPVKQFDLTHAFNRIPVERKPFIVGFESHLPRAFGLEGSSYFRWLSRRLASDDCRGIIAISECAKTIFQHAHADQPWAPELLAKLHVRYPNVAIDESQDEVQEQADGPIRIAFVGNHFGRKGGCVAVTLAEEALRRRVPVEITVVSGLQVGGGIWTDPVDVRFFDRYIRLLELENVRHFPSLENEQVVALLKRSHFSLLTTFGDTFGYSAIESMAHYTPVIGTRQGALPEFILDGVNGILLNLPTSDVGEWIHSSSPRRGSKAFETLFVEEVHRLAHEALDRIVQVMATPGALGRMRRSAREQAHRYFDHRDAAAYWDDFYEVAVEGTSQRHAFRQ